TLKVDQRILRRSRPIMARVIGPILPKNSKYEEDVNEVVGWMRDFGLLQQFIEQVRTQTEKNGIKWLKSDAGKNSRTYKRIIGYSDENLKSVRPLKLDLFSVVFGASFLG